MLSWRACAQVRLPSKAVESFSGRSPSSRSGSTINFGPYEHVEPWAGGQLRVHFENNGPFAEALSLMREIQVPLHPGLCRSSLQAQISAAGRSAGLPGVDIDIVVHP